jgi:pectinesterase
MSMKQTCPLRLIAVIQVASCAAALAKDITVDSSGAADFRTVQEAIDSIPAGNSQRVRILIMPGKYVQQLTVPKDKPMISLIGQGDKPEQTLLSYNLKASDRKPAATQNVGTTGSSSTFIHGDDFEAENLTFENSAGDNVGQAVAMKSTGDRLVFRNCQFLGFQDTLYPTGGRSYFKDCYITGDTDFIFGNGTAVFDHCIINSSDGGYITAANTRPQSPFGFVFLDCTLTAGANVRVGSVWLGRPWQWDRGSKASVVLIRTKMGPQIAPEGWHPWSTQNTDPSANTRYAEFGSTDEQGRTLVVTKRVGWSSQLAPEEAAKITVRSVLAGSDAWDPSARSNPKGQ